MISGFNYSNNNNYNITNSNPNYIIQHNQNNLNFMYRNSSNSNLSNGTIYSNKNKFVYYDIGQQPGNNIKKKNDKNKTVKFNDKVSVIKVESYKKYNRIDDDFNLYGVVNDDKQNTNRDRKKGDSCQCGIV